MKDHVNEKNKIKMENQIKLKNYRKRFYTIKKKIVNFDHKIFQLEIPNQEENNIKSSNIIFLLLTFPI
jgi:hypothetical protein